MPSTKVRPIGHEDRLSMVDHLDELRTRLIFCIVAFAVCFGVAYWQNNAILQVVNQPFTDAKAPTKQSDFTSGKGGALAQTARYDRGVSEALSAAARVAKVNQAALVALARDRRVPAATVTQVNASSRAVSDFLRKAQAVGRAIPDATPKPVTLGVTEPFVTTFTVSSYAALLLALPFILFQLYAFLLPAFSPQERKTAVPFMAMVPVLFVCGVLFGYFVALPRAVDFLLNFNSDKFDILVGAQQYYKFSVVLLLAVGLLFQIPVGVLAITRLGILTPKQLAKNRGYIVLAVAVVAAVATPTPDPVTMLVTMAPLLILFELSLLLSRIFAKRAAGRPSRWDWDDEGEDDGDDEDDEDDDDPYGFHEPEPGDDPPGKDDDPGDDDPDPGDGATDPPAEAADHADAVAHHADAVAAASKGESERVEPPRSRPQSDV